MMRKEKMQNNKDRYNEIVSKPIKIPPAITSAFDAFSIFLPPVHLHDT